MKRNGLFLSYLALAGLLFIGWSNASALDYEVYRMPSQNASAAKLASISQIMPDVPEVDYTVTDPANDSTITTIHVGERIMIAAGERVYLADPDTFWLTGIGEGALVFLAPGAVIKVPPLFRSGGPEALTQIVGPGSIYGTIGLFITGQATLENMLLAGHDTAIQLENQADPVVCSGNRLFLTKNAWTVFAPALSLAEKARIATDGDLTMRFNIKNSFFWNNSMFDLSFMDMTAGRRSIRAENCAFLSLWGHGHVAFNIGFDWNEERTKYTAEFVDCIFSEPTEQWDNPNWGSGNTDNPALIVKENRPGRDTPIHVWPVMSPTAPADFDADGTIGLADFNYLATDFGKGLGQSRFIRFLDLDVSGQVDLQDIVLWSKAYLGLAPDVNTETLANELANTSVGRELLKAVAKQGAVAEAMLPDPILGPVLEPYLQLTAVEEEATVPTAFSLHQNYPNPFNPTTVIGFSLAERTMTQLAVYNLSGQIVKTLLSGMLPTGHHQFIWDGTDEAGLPAGSGTYLCVMRAGNHTFFKKMLLLR